MVLESIIKPKIAEHKPLHIMIISIAYTFIAAFFSTQLFPAQSSILSVALISILFVPLFQKIFELEERKEDLYAEKKLKGNLIHRHKRVIYVFSAFFLGVILATSFMFVFIPNDTLFDLQENTLRSIATGSATQTGNFERFFVNNTQLLLLFFALSVLFGSGAIIILTWNASVIAVYIGIFIQSSVSSGLGTGTAYLLGVPLALGSIALHGVPEIVAYFIGGLAGGVLSVGIIREKLESKEFRQVFKDSLIFLGIAEMLIIGAAFIEAFI